jgi:hypothetical protein
MRQEIRCLARQEGDLVRETISPDAFDDLLRDRGLDYTKTAVLGQVEVSTISRIARGLTKARPQTIVTLATALGISPKRLEAMTRAAWEAAHPEKVAS